MLDGSEKPIFSEKKNVLRLIGFLIAFAIAVTFITVGVVQIGKKDPGLYEVDADANGDLPLYASGVHLQYYFTGSSDEIKSEMAMIKAIYSQALKLSYQWLDAKNTYLETPNLAKINQNAGQAVKLQEPLFRILQDALEKTERGEGYTIYASPLLAVGETLLYANQPEPLDPVNDAEYAELIAKLDEAARQAAGSLVLNEDDLTATLTVPEDYAALLEEYGLQANGILNLGVLADAYRLQYLAGVLEEKGYSNGYLTSNSGMTILLKDYVSKTGAYCLYSLEEDGSPVISATKTMPVGTAACCFRVFGLADSEIEYYTVANGETTLYRNPYQMAFPNEQPLLSALAVVQNETLADAAYVCSCLMAAKDAGSALAFAKTTEVEWLIDLNDGEAKLYLSDRDGVSSEYQIIED